MRLRDILLSLAAFFVATTQTPSAVLEISDYATMPITGKLDGTAQNNGLLSRVNVIREEPGGADRLFVVDQNGPIYLLDKKTKTFKTYLDLNGREGHIGLFQKFFGDTGYGT